MPNESLTDVKIGKVADGGWNDFVIVAGEEGRKGCMKYNLNDYW